MKSKKNLVIAVLFLIGFKMVALNPAQQPNTAKGYVINLKGDTVKGDIKVNPKKDIDQYTKVTMKTSAGVMTTFQPAKIKQYVVDGQSFVSRKIDGDAVLLKLVSVGNLNLYEYKTEVYVMNNTKIVSDYYIEKKGETEPIKVKSGRGFKKQMAELMADKVELAKEIEGKKYEYGNILDLFEQYNGTTEVENNQ